MPKRIQRQRTKGWRMPANAVYVGRPSPWGNVFTVGMVTCGHRSAGECSCNTFRRETAAEAVEDFANIPRSEKALARIRAALRGKDLACWCPLGSPCHADVLLKIANEGAEHLMAPMPSPTLDRFF